MATPTSPGVVSAVPLTGQNHIDGILEFNKWGGSVGTAADLTYSLRTNSSIYSTNSVTGYGPTTGTGEPWQPWNLFDSAQIAGIHNALNAWSDVANLHFMEVIDSSTVAGDIRFGTESSQTTSSGRYPFASAKAGDVWFGTNSNLLDPTLGTYAYLTFLHEIGHALGLDHPHGPEGRVIADSSLDALQFTVMSYRDFVGDALNNYQSTFHPTTPMLYDIATIQYLYGANMSTRSGDTTYSWTLGQSIYETIWDGGGDDTIDWSNQSSAASINLNAGRWSYLGPNRWDGHVNTNQNLAIAYNVVVENATGGSEIDTLVGNDIGNDLNGGGGNDLMTGGLGNDRFDWDASERAGDDTMYGGTGDDVYVISGNDQVIEFASEGIDLIWANQSYSLASLSYVENLSLFGTAAANLTGNDSSNTLRGNSADNIVDGRAGADTLVGGAGNDTYVVDNAGDVIAENASEGADLVQSSTTYTLSANLESLVLTGGTSINGSGNTLNNALTGNSGNNILDGGASADTLTGAAGNDTYYIDALDTLVELSGQGIDTVVAGFTYTLGAEFENLTLTGTNNLTGTGNGVNNDIRGNAGDNVLTGGGGNDTLLGGAGNDMTMLSLLKSAYSLQYAGGRLTVTSAGDTTTVGTMETLRFGNGQQQSVGTFFLEAAKDFNADGHADILWRNVNDGRVSSWLMDGLTVQTGAVFNNVPLEWQIQDRADFDGDGKSDILWRNVNDGSVSAWLMDGLTVKSGAVFNNVPLEWQIKGTADFDGDGSGDILWRNKNDGSVSAWLMDGLTVRAGEVFSNVPLVWQIQDTADLNGDGSGDILWRNTSNGNVSAWLMDGLTVQTGAEFSNVPLEWQVKGTGDFDADGKSDILWRNAADGRVSAWRMDGLTVKEGAVFNDVPLIWQIAGTGDFNNDLRTDILWRATDGRVSEWLMNGLSVQDGAVFSDVPTDWVIA